MKCDFPVFSGSEQSDIKKIFGWKWESQVLMERFLSVLALFTIIIIRNVELTVSGNLA